MTNSPKGRTRENRVTTYVLQGDILYLSGSLTIASIGGLLQYHDNVLRDYKKKMFTINLDGLVDADSGGITAIYYIRNKFIERDIDTQITGGNESIQKKLDLFRREAAEKAGTRPDFRQTPGIFEQIGLSTTFVFNKYITSFFKLTAEITHWSIIGLFTKRTYRKGEVVNQAVLMGVNAALIVGMMSFVIGLVLALQSAAQLRTFGANIYIVDLTVIAMMSEMGPLITAIMVAGRSGSSIAAEIATMKVTSETDALKTMGLLPVRFVVVPKMYGGLITMPFLTILADIMGILGGMIIASSYLDISPLVFLNRMKESLYLKDVIFGIAKSLVFSYLIVISGSYFGFQADKVSSGVGRVTTNAVVFSISLVILADSIMGLLFY